MLRLDKALLAKGAEVDVDIEISCCIDLVCVVFRSTGCEVFKVKGINRPAAGGMGHPNIEQRY